MSDATFRARVDDAGRLIAADPDFAALNLRAGGGDGQALAMPPLERIARLAQRLGVTISRDVAIADGERDLDFWVRATPGSDGVELLLSGVSERAAWRGGERIAPAAFIRAEADWTWETDGALRLTGIALNDGATAGFDPTAMLGLPLTSLFLLATEEDGALPILDAVAQRHDFSRQRARLRGSDAIVELSAIVRRDAAGAFAGFVGGTRAIAPVEPDSGAGLSAAFSRRLDGALRRPLTAIVANADSIGSAQEGPLGEQYIGYAGDIASAGRHLLALIDDLVDLEAIERDDFATDVDAIDLADLARRAAGLFAVRAADAEVHVARPDLDAVAPVVGEFRRALQVLVNLIGNAVRYAPRGSTVTVALIDDGARHGVVVTDEGKGIAPDDQALIFEKFGRVDNAEAGGSGLGLYIARRLARTMGGDLTVESTPGAGARFRFTLPKSS